MRNFTRIVLSIGFVLFLTNLGISQNPSPRVMSKPSRYYQPGKAELENYLPAKADEVRQGTYWSVYSDRDDNPTYTEAQGGVVKQTVNYLESFWVIGESGSFLHIAKDPDFKKNSDYLTSGWIDYGWIHKSKLLLWEDCLYSSNKIAKKAMILNTVESLNDVTSGSGDLVSFYKKPSLESITDNQTNLYNVFFIYKRDGNALLLAKVPKIMDRLNPGNDLWGWVSIKRLMVWEHRIAIEPNWDEDAAKERRDRNSKAIIFCDEPSAKGYKEKQTGNPDCEEYLTDPYEKRNKGSFMRFPLVENRSGLLKTAFIGKPQTTSGQNLTLEENADIQWKYNEIRAKRRNINIVFVVDATTSMRQYFQPIANAIAESVDKLSLSNNKYKFGGVVYRDLPEGMDNLVESFKLNNQFKEFNKWLTSRFSDDKNQNDLDLGEAVNFGLREALRSLSIPKDETNIVILVGDAGNHARQDASQIGRDEIVKLLVEKNAGLLAFQVNNAGQIEYGNFVAESKNLMLLAAREFTSSISGTAQAMHFELKPADFEKIGDVWRLNNSVNIGRVVFCEKNSSMQPNRLQIELADFIESTAERNDKLLSKVNKAVMDGRRIDNDLNSEQNEDKYVSSFGPSIVHFLKQLNLSQEKYDIITKERVQFCKIGYAADRIDGYKYPLFQSVLFLTREELGEILGDIRKLTSVGNGNEARSAMADTWRQLLKQHMGDKNMEGIANASLQDISSKVFGLPSKSSFIAKVTLSQIIDKVAFPDHTFEQWTAEIEKKYFNLQKIYNSDSYEYSFRSNDQPFYWISENNLP